MLDFVVSVVNPFEMPKRPSELVVFTNHKPFIQEAELEDYLTLVSEYAEDYKCCVVPQLYCKDNYLCMSIVDKSGKFIAEQKALSLRHSYRRVLKKNTDVWIYDLNFAKILLCVDNDIISSKTLGAAEQCDVIVSAEYIEGGQFDIEKDIIDRAWRAAQLTCKFVVHSTNGYSSIIAPCTMTKRKSFDGFIAQPSMEMPVSSEIYSRWLKYAKDTRYFKYKRKNRFE